MPQADRAGHDVPRQASAAGGCELAATTCVKTAWRKFRQLLPVLTSHHLPYKMHSHVYISDMWSLVLHVNETEL